MANTLTLRMIYSISNAISAEILEKTGTESVVKYICVEYTYHY